jgi:hypothetical protein
VFFAWFFVVKLWWIAGESWEVDGQDSGSKNMPLFPDLFLRDSHFGNPFRASMLNIRDEPAWVSQRVSGQLFVSERLNLEIQFVTRRSFSPGPRQG